MGSYHLVDNTLSIMMRKLHIGGQQKADGWEILNANSGPNVDHVCNASNLAQFPDGTFAEIYASHVVEHFDYKGELQATLKEWFRVMQPNGIIYVSVPDLDVLAGMFLQKDRYSLEDRFYVMRIIFGGHVDQYDYHVTGLNEDFLTYFLHAAGFVNVRRISEFGMFDDTSGFRFKGNLISLNVIAEKPQ